MNDLLALMHDTAHDLGRLNAQEKLILKKLESVSDIELKDYILQKIGVVTQSRINITQRLDMFYTNNKKA